MHLTPTILLFHGRPLKFTLAKVFMFMNPTRPYVRYLTAWAKIGTYAIGHVGINEVPIPLVAVSQKHFCKFYYTSVS
jgi:hypothetical protein